MNSVGWLSRTPKITLLMEVNGPDFHVLLQLSVMNDSDLLVSYRSAVRSHGYTYFLPVSRQSLSTLLLKDKVVVHPEREWGGIVTGQHPLVCFWCITH